MERLPPPQYWQEYLDGVIQWLLEKWGEDTACPYCGNEKWEIGPVVAYSRVPAWPDQKDQQGEPAFDFFPVVPVSCSNCGQMVQIRALDIFDPQNP